MNNVPKCIVNYSDGFKMWTNSCLFLHYCVVTHQSFPHCGMFFLTESVEYCSAYYLNMVSNLVRLSLWPNTVCPRPAWAADKDQGSTPGLVGRFNLIHLMYVFWDIISQIGKSVGCCPDKL